jgi:hypothetical protein
MPTEISGSTGVNKIQDNTIVNADINSSAAIAGSKLVMPTGSVLQVVSAKITNEFTSTSSSYSDSAVTLSITPSSSSNKVLVMVTLNGCITWNNDTYAQFVLKRGSTEIHDMEASGGNTASTASNGYGTVSVNHLDSPSSTSSVTYTVAGASANNSSYVRFNSDGANSRRAESSITLMEIAG